MEDTGSSPWEFADWIRNCTRDARDKLGMDDVQMALYLNNATIDLVDKALAEGRASNGLKLALLQLLQVKGLLIIEVSE